MHASTKGQRHNRLTAAILLGLCVGMGTVAYTPTAAAQTAEVKRYDLPAGTLDEALAQFGRQSGLQMLVPPELVAGHRVEAISGEFTNAAALERLLRGTGLSWKRIPSGAVVIKKAERIPAEEPTTQADTGSEENVTEFETITVTGTNIRGIAPETSPLTVYTRNEIEQTGAGSTEDFIRTIPQNFGLVGAGTAANSGNNSQALQNRTFGASVNLRGLGAGSTLVLVNGNRLAPAGGDGSFADISLIPIGAVEAVEVLTDGASATYGADAVAGVVNFVLRDDYQGSESSGRYALTSGGGAAEWSATQLMGTTWANGNAMLIYEHNQRKPLYAADRDFIPDRPGPFQVLPRQNRDSLYIHGRHDLNLLEVSVDLLWSDREFSSDTVPLPNSASQSDGGARQSGGVLSLNHDLWGDWKLKASGAYFRSVEHVRSIRTFGSLIFDDRTKARSAFLSTQLKADGTLLEINGGSLRGSFGLEHRREIFSDYSTALGSVGTGLRRGVDSAFGELHVPLISNKNSSTFAQRLVLTIAGRYDHYEDIGSSFDPKVGVLWSPIKGLAFRSTYGTAYRAPPLAQLSSTGQFYQVLSLPDSSAPDDITYTLLPGAGSNPDLGPESAESFTAGFDFEPAAFPNFRASATYFRMTYRDRIARPPLIGSLASLYSQRATLSPFIYQPPGLEFMQDLFARGLVIGNPLGLSPSEIESFFDIRLQNIAETEAEGVEFNASYDRQTSFGDIGVFINGDYLINIDHRSSAAVPSASLLNTVFNPMDLRVRAGINWTHDKLSSTLTINHSDSYQSNLVSPSVKVSSWRTLDFQFAYQVPEGRSGLTIAAGMQNITNKKPPQVINVIESQNFGYDATNASPLGRVIYVGITKKW